MLIIAGGISALQTAATLVAVPFSVIMVLMMVATARALLKENRARDREQQRWLAEQVAAHIDEHDLMSGNGRSGGGKRRFWPSRH